MTNMNMQKKKSGMDSRFAAWKILYQVLEENQYSHVELQRIFKENPELTARDRAFIERIVRGTLEHLYEIDAYIDKCSKLPLKKLKPVIRTILRMSVYQLKYMDSIPARAVCNEAVRLTNRLKLSNLKGYVNGVLRNLSRDSEENGINLLENCSPEQQLVIKYSMPEWIVKRFISMFDLEKTEGILQAFMKPVKLSVYRNPAENSSETLKAELEAHGVICEELPYGIDGFYLNEVNNLVKLPAFVRGAFLVQDVSSMVQGLVTAAQKDQYIIDVCAAPGGKAFHAAMDMQGSGCVDCADISVSKTALIQENAQRLKLNNVKVSIRDATVFQPELEEKADIVIADLPCSGLGIIGRKPEIRYNIKEDDIYALAKLQKEILNVVWKYVKPGGRLIYSTCTLAREEDEENYQYLTTELPFEAESLEKYLPFGPKSETLEKGYLKLIPGEHPCDGFFIGSAIRKQ